MGPLEGLKVLDLSRLLPGPYCTKMLGDMGADVIKIEEPGKGDYSREFPPFRKDLSCWFMEVNRNKRSVILDLKTAEGKTLFLKLVAGVDVVVESFRPGVLKRLGVDFTEAVKVNPKIVYCSLSGYGASGPLAEQADHDIGYQSLAGLISMSGEKDGRPAIPGALIADMNSASIAGMSILAAVRYAERSGRGQEIRVSLYDASINMMPGVAATYFGDAVIHQRGNNWLTGQNPNYNIYATEDNRYISVGCLEKKFWINLCNALGKPEFVTAINDSGKFNYLKQELAKIFLTKTMEEWVKFFAGKDACVCPILNFAEAANSEQTKADEMVIKIEDKELGEYRQMGFVPKFSLTPCEFYRRAPRLGEHTEEVLKELDNH